MPRRVLAALALALFAGPAPAGPVSVFTQVWESVPGSGGEIRVPGLGNWATLTWGGGLDPVVVVAADQTRGRQPVVGFWPVVEFRDPAQYQAQLAAVAVLPPTAVKLYAEVWDGAPGGAGVEYRRLFLDATVTARVSATPGLTAVDWSFAAPPAPVVFGDGTVVTLGYEPVARPPGLPQIQFADGSPAVGFPGPVYYPTVLDAEVEVSRPAVDPGPPPADPPGDPPGAVTTPEPATGLLLAGFAAGGAAARRRIKRTERVVTP